MLGPDAAGLLRRLGSGVRPAGGDAAAVVADSPDFQALLRSARRGEFRSGRRVRVEERFGVTLSEAEREELDAAADAAEAAGAARLAVVRGGGALIVDLASRSATDARALRGGGAGTAGVVTGIDAVAVLGSGEAEDEVGGGGGWVVAPGLRAGLPGRVVNASLMRSLGARAALADQTGV